jgi:hypothetical protein
MRRWLLAAFAVPATVLAQPISNGVPATGDPAVIALVATSDLDQVGCTASVIGPHTAITAAHCVAGRDPRTLQVFFGSSIADGGVYIAVSDAGMHPGFDPGGRDVALITLREPAPVMPLVLEPMTLDASLVDTSFRVVGFGITGLGLGDAGLKREGTARIAAVRPEELVAVPDPSLSCLGDSGGPAILPAGTIAGVVSRGDAGCMDHAVYTRVDFAQSTFIQPYLAETAPGAASVGEACFYEEHCNGGPCLQTNDDPLLYFCSRSCQRDSDCPATMECASDGCRYPAPSPGALGSSCAANTDCTTRLCLDQVCTRSCDDTNACPADYECLGNEVERYCFAATGGCGGCAGGGSDGSWIVLAAALLLLTSRRGTASSGRRSSRRG